MPPFMCLLVGQSDEVVNCETVEAENTAHAMNKSEVNAAQSCRAFIGRDLAGRAASSKDDVDRSVERPKPPSLLERMRAKPIQTRD